MQFSALPAATGFIVFDGSESNGRSSSMVDASSGRCFFASSAASSRWFRQNGR